jgi:O-antigen ligase
VTAQALSRPGANDGIILAGLIGAVALAAVAATSPKAAIYAAAGVAALIVVFRSLLAGVALFVVLTFPEALPGSLGVGPTLAKPLGLLLFVSWFLLMLADRDHAVPFLPRDAPLLTGALVALVVWATASLAWASDSAATLESVSRLAQLVGLVFVTYSAVRSRRDLLILVSAVLVGAAITCGYALGNGTVAHGRLTGSLFDPNTLAADVVVAMSFAAFLLLGVRRFSVKVVLLLLLALFSVVLAQTQSRSGVLALGAAALAAVITAGPLRGRVTAMLLIASALAVGYYFYAAPPQLRERIASIGSGTSESTAGRADTWQIAVRMSQDHPVAGVGLGNFPARELDYVAGTLNLTDIVAIRQSLLVVHNSYLELIAELGIVGLLLFLAVLWWSAGRLAALVLHRGRDDSATLLLARAITTGMAALLTAQIFLSGEYSKQLWLLLGMSAAAASLARSPQEATAPSHHGQPGFVGRPAV